MPRVDPRAETLASYYANWRSAEARELTAKSVGGWASIFSAPTAWLYTESWFAVFVVPIAFFYWLTWGDELATKKAKDQYDLYYESLERDASHD